MSMSLFIVLSGLWALSGTAYWLFRAVAPRRYNAYSAGRLDTLFAIFIATTFAVCIFGVIVLAG